LKESRPMTVIEIRPHRNGWKVCEAPGIEPVFATKIRQSIMRRADEIRILDSSGEVERVIPFNETDRKL